MGTLSIPRTRQLRIMANALSGFVFLVALWFVFGEGVPDLTWDSSSDCSCHPSAAC